VEGMWDFSSSIRRTFEEGAEGLKGWSDGKGGWEGEEGRRGRDAQRRRGLVMDVVRSRWRRNEAHVLGLVQYMAQSAVNQGRRSNCSGGTEMTREEEGCMN
jgi:hypothetical protein